MSQFRGREKINSRKHQEEALAMADMDINENWERYKERYLRRMRR
jgi:hypothetical protein